MGLLDTNAPGVDPNIAGNMPGLLSQFQPSQADIDVANKRAELQFFLGLLGAPEGGEFQRLGDSGREALQTQQAYLANLQAQKLRAMQLGGSALDLLNKQFQYNDAQLLRQQQMDAARRFAPGVPQPMLSDGAGITAAGPIGAPPGIPNPPGSVGMNDRGIGPNPRTALQPPAMLDSLPRPTTSNTGQGVPGGMPDRRQMAARLNAIGDYWSSVGRMPQADAYYKAAQAAMPQLKEQRVLTQNGQRVVVNLYNDGSHEILPDVGPDQEKAHFLDTGSQVGAVDPFTGKPIMGGGLYNKTMTPGEVESNRIRAAEADPFGMLGVNKNPVSLGNTGAGGPSAGASGDALLQSLPKPIADQVKALAEGRMAFPAGFALKSPYWQNMISMVSQYDPSFDAVNYNARAKTRNDFTSGKSAQQANALNTVIGHLGQLSDAADALNNTSLPMLNTLSNFAATQTGDPRIRQFDITRKAVVDELTRVYRQAGGSEQDIKTWSTQLDVAGSPAQLHGAIAQISGLLESKIQALNDQYQKGMGTTAGGLRLLSDKSQQALAKMESRAGGGSVDTPQDKPPQLAPAAKGNTTATVLINRVLQSGDQAKIEELRRLGWLQ